MEFLSQVLQKLKPKANWNSFQEEKSINLSKKIRLLLQTQKASNKFVKNLLAIHDSREVSSLILQDINDNNFLITGADSTLFRKLIDEYPNLYPEYSKLIKQLLKDDNLPNAIRKYGVMPILINLSLLIKKDIISEEKYMEIVEHVYAPNTIKNFMAIAALFKKVVNNDHMQEIIQLALQQGIIDIADLAYDENDINLLKNFIKKNIKLPDDKYIKDRIYTMFNDLKYFIISVNRTLSEIFKKEIKENMPKEKEE